MLLTVPHVGGKCIVCVDCMHTMFLLEANAYTMYVHIVSQNHTPHQHMKANGTDSI